MLILLASLAFAAGPAAAEPAPAAESAPGARSPAGRMYPCVTTIPGQTVQSPTRAFTPEQRVANVSGVVMDRFGVIREIRGAAPALYVDGMRVFGTGPRR